MKKIITLGLILSVLCISHNSYAQPGDTQPSVEAVSLVETAFQTECAYLYSIAGWDQDSFPNRCGNIQVIANAGLPYWGFTQSFPTPTGLQVEIRYNPTILSKIYSQFGQDAVFAVFAHEVGHVMDGFTNPQLQVPWTIGASWAKELRADAWAGCAMKRTGRNTKPFESATAVYTGALTADTPPVPSVIQVVEQAYASC